MEDFYGDYFKWWVGVVRERVDETHVRVRIFGVHPLEESELDMSDLPLALVTYPTSGGQAGSGSSTHNLDVDSWVYGFSPDSTFMQPIIIGVIQGSDYSMSTYGTNGGQFVGEGGDSSYPDVDTGGTMNIPGGSNIAKTYNYVHANLKSEGSSSDPHLHASALCGVLLLETSGINPQVVGGWKGRAWGICQWLGGRRTQLFRKYGRTKRLDHQLDFMWWELNNTERSAKRRWLSATNLPDAVAGFASFERAEEWQRTGRGSYGINRRHSNFKKRLKYAYQVYNTQSPIEKPSTDFNQGVIT